MSIKTEIFTYIAVIFCFAAILYSIHNYNNIPVSSRATSNDILATRRWVVDYSTNAISSISNYVDNIQAEMATTGALAAVQVTAENALELATYPKISVNPTWSMSTDSNLVVEVVPEVGIYNISVRGDSDISFDLSSIDITNNVARWETWIKVFAPGMTVGLPSTNAVQYLEIPDLTTTTANELLQISWQAWMDGTNLMMQGHLYNRNTQMPPPTLAELRTYHYGSPAIEESPDEWFAFDSGTGTITAFNYEEGRKNVVIPWEINGVAVEAIGDTAFAPDHVGPPIETVIGPKTLLSIGDYAFYYCASLTSVSLPAATSIGDNAFEGCNSPTSISLPSATSIGDYAFYYCASLSSVSLPAATSIGDNAFASCASLSSVSLPVATSIGDSAFDSCTNLTSVSLPSATSIGYSAFAECGYLTSVSLPAATSIEPYAFGACIPLTSVYFGISKPTEDANVFYSYGDPINVTVYYPTGAAEWSGVTTWSGKPTATYTPPAP